MITPYSNTISVRTRKNLLLDLYPNAAAAYSLRGLSLPYVNGLTPYACQVRNSSNAAADIGFVFNSFTGEYDLDTIALLAHCDGGNGVVTSLYDQGSNGYNILQVDGLLQPQIVDSGSVILENGKPSISFDGTNDYLLNSNFANINGLNHIYFFQVLQTTNTSILTESRCVIWFPQSSSWGNVYSSLSQSQVGFRFGTGQVGNNQLASIPTSTNLRLMSTYKNNTIDRADINGVNAINYTAALSTTANNLNSLNIGRGLNQFMSMNLSEIIIYFSDESSNITNIEQNINDFYSIY